MTPVICRQRPLSSTNGSIDVLTRERGQPVKSQAMVTLTTGIGSDSAHDVPLVEGCVGWLVCKLVPEPHNQQTYDLFIGSIIAAWTDESACSNGRWHFETAPDALRTIHHVAGGQFLVTGGPDSASAGKC